MKKYLLILAVSIFGFIAFSNAEDIICSSSDCDISTFTFSVGDTLNSYSDTSLGSCSLIFTTDSTDVSVPFGDFDCYRVEFGGGWVSCNYNRYPELPITFDTDTTFNVSSQCVDDSLYPFTATLGVSHSVGTEGDNSGSLLPDGVGNLSGIISSLSTTLNEFIPYLVYVGIGIIGALIGFVAIKRLINWIRAKIFSSFSSGRRRR